MAKKRIGFIGLGNMGLGMAQNLVKKGFEVTTCAHARREGIEALKQLGAKEAGSPREVARTSDVIISVVRDSAQTDEIMLGPEGAWTSLKPGSTIILSSTLSPGYCQKLAARANEKGFSVLDAPVSGASTGSEAGTLTFMVGGDEKLFNECMPVFKAMGKNIFHLGGIGMGQAFKLVNNLALTINAAAVSESLAFGLAAGLKLDKMLEVLKVSSGNSWVAENYHFMRDLRRDSPETRFALTYDNMDTALAYARELKICSLPIIGLLSQMDLNSFMYPPLD